MKLVTVALSGGMDSTAALLKLFKQYDFDKITAHHVKLLTREGADRVQAERRACHQIHQWFRENGMHFEYSESEYECLFDMRSNTPDIVIVAPIVTQAMLHYASGITYEQLHIAYGDHLDEFRRSAFVGRWVLVENIFADIMKTVTSGWYNIPEYSVMAPNYKSTKKDNYEYLPDDLRELTTSCRKGRKCGNCAPCLEIEAIEANYGTEDTE